MKHKPQTLTLFTFAIVVAVSAGAVLSSSFRPVRAAGPDESAANGTAADETAPAAQAKDTKPAKPSLKRSDKTAAQVFTEISGRLDDVVSLSCDIRQTILMSGQRFIATGSYKQSSGNRMRLEYRIYPLRYQKKEDTVGNVTDSAPDESKARETGSLLQVSDGSVLWSYWVNGDSKKLSRRNIGEIIDAVDKVESYSPTRTLQDLGVGGLQTLTAQMQVGMNFGAVQEQQMGSTKLLVLTGRWTAKTMKDVFSIEDPTKAVLPEYIPDYVRIYVDAATMLPRRVQYLKKHPDPEQKKIRPLVTLDLRSINLQAEFSDDTFVFPRPDDKDVKEVDLTSQVIQAIQNLAPDKNDPSAENEKPATQTPPE